ncbi:MAG: SMP-30/gluconolactonase/LRE family protein [Nitrospirota bacterium]|nr:SMP-30/gluconolactonase/LRE family protein [Nitrospirota bacterium]
MRTYGGSVGRLPHWTRPGRLLGLVLTMLSVGIVTPQGAVAELGESSSRLQRIATGFLFVEGPVWHPRGFLIFSDIPTNTLYRWDPGYGVSVFSRPSGRANGNTLDRWGRLVSAHHERYVSRIELGGAMTILASMFQGKALNSPNDVVVGRHGSLYFTDPPYGIHEHEEELGFYGIYRIDPGGRLTLLVAHLTRPNGLAFSPDFKRLYVNDSATNQIHEFAVTPEGGLSERPLFATMHDPTRAGVADGLKVDQKGNVYSIGPGGVWMFAPTGALLKRLEVPEKASNLAFGDADLKTLYVTASTSVYRMRVSVPGTPLG